MAQSTGKIGVTTENIFPIIKKFLYSDQEIFLRELVSNAVDATQKLRAIAASDPSVTVGDTAVEVLVDKETRTLTIRDRGVGMTREEVEKYINQIALSGAEDFFAKYKDAANIIGHFGLGFYSAFMVSDAVEIDTLSWQPGAEPVHWRCEGEPEYTLDAGERKERGTDIVLHVSKEADEFLERARIEGLLNKYCRFLPVPIVFGKKKQWKDGKEVATDEPNIINSVDPLWAKRPADLKEEDYNEFYRYLFPQNEEPLFSIHLNVDFPFALTGILYFPRLKSHFDIQKNRIQLYSNQVFVTDIVEGIVPDFLTLLHGVLDSPDIPLNVSRSSLQSDSNVRKIASHITKKVCDRLQELFSKERENYESKWDSLRLFVQYGIISDEDFYGRAKEFLLLKNVDGKYFTLKEYQALVEGEQKDRHGKTVYLYTSDPQAQWAAVEQAKAKGYDVLLLDGQLDTHMVNFLEGKLENAHFARVDSDTLERLIEKEDAREIAFSDNEQKYLRLAFNGTFGQEQGRSIYVVYDQMAPEAQPALITQSEFMRRMRDMASMNPSASFYSQMPESYNLVLNTAHPLVVKLKEQVVKGEASLIEETERLCEPLRAELKSIREKNRDKKPEEMPQEDRDRERSLNEDIDSHEEKLRVALEARGKDSQLAHQLLDLALLAAGLLKGEPLARFIKRSVQLIEPGE